MSNSTLDFMKDVMGAPLGDLISSVGAGVASAQAALDAASLSQTLQIYSEGDDAMAQALRDIGYQPTFYALPETEVEAQVSLSFSVTETSSPSTTTTSPFVTAGKAKMYTTPVSASMTNRFNLNAAASAKLRFKIVPVPPPGDAGEIRVIPNLVPPVTSPPIPDKTKAQAVDLLDQFGLLFEMETGSESTTVFAHSEGFEAGTIVKAGTAVKVKMRAIVPDFDGKTAEEITASCEALGLDLTLAGPTGGVGDSQSIAATTIVDPETAITVTLI